jgi:DNA polymerase-4
MSYGTVLHVNAVGFAAAIEANKDWSLRGRPYVVANENAPRAVVLDTSTVAHKEGIRRGMVLSYAKNICPELETRRPRPELYRFVEDTLRTLCLSFTPLVERAGSGHLYLDLEGTCRINGQPVDAAQRLSTRIYESTGLMPSLALASNKTVTKIGTRVFRPSGFVALSYNEEGQLIRRQPVELLPGVGPMLLGRLSLLDIEEIGRLADLTTIEARAIGPRGPELVTRAQGIDASPVDPEAPERKTVTGDIILEPDTADPFMLRIWLSTLVAKVAFNLRKQGFGTRSASVAITYTDGASGGATMKSRHLCVRDDEVLSLAYPALEKATTRRVRIRSISLTLSDLAAASSELDLFEPEDTRRIRLQAVIDKVHTRFGSAALVSANSLLIAGASL